MKVIRMQYGAYEVASQLSPEILSRKNQVSAIFDTQIDLRM